MRESPISAAALTPAQIEDAIIVASLAHMTARTPKQAHEAWLRLMALKQQRDSAKRNG